MSRRTTSHSSNSRKRGGKSNSSKKGLMIGIAIVALALIGFLVYKLINTDGYVFERVHLDKYVELTHENDTLLNAGAGVYVDMSDGMNAAYAKPQNKEILKAIINKLSAEPAIQFHELSNGAVAELDTTHTELYNYIVNPANYDKERAPIEKALKQIVANGQPALLVTDFEEYKGTVIEKSAYAKQYFIEWLKKGFNITFYKWEFAENNQNKLMFLAVFDDNANRLASLINTAISTTNPTLPKYVLAGREFAYPIATNYLSLKQGGNYHNSKGMDIVTGVIEDGGKESYYCYSKPLATADGNSSKYAPLDCLHGDFAEYYPVGVSWKGALENAKQMTEEGVPSEDVFSHLLGNLFVDFHAQDGFNIDAIEVRVFNVQATLEAIGTALNAGQGIDVKALKTINKPEVNMFLTAGMQKASDGWMEIFVDWDEKFSGTFVGDIPSTDLMQANIVIAKATPDIAKAMEFFSWEGNNSLADSVKEALTKDTSNPASRVLYTYFIRSIAAE